MFTDLTLKLIFDRTSGHCHFCGDPLIFGKYGSRRDGDQTGAWEADHVIQRRKGGHKSAENCLATCVRCNRLRWHRRGDDLRELIFLGLIAKEEINKSTDIGKRLLLLRNKRMEMNKKRRRKVG
jgi:5-methylcytosine-specific restriction endonuclease McrA